MGLRVLHLSAGVPGLMLLYSAASPCNVTAPYSAVLGLLGGTFPSSAPLEQERVEAPCPLHIFVCHVCVCSVKAPAPAADSFRWLDIRARGSPSVLSAPVGGYGARDP